MNKSKEIIYTGYQHGMMHDEVNVCFNPEVCQVFLAEPLSLDSKREFVQSIFLYHFIKDFGDIYAESFGNMYGVTTAKVEVNIVIKIFPYVSIMEDKITGQISAIDIDKDLDILEKVLYLDEEIKKMKEYETLRNSFLDLSREYVQHQKLNIDLHKKATNKTHSKI